MSKAIIEKAVLWKKGNLYEDFFVGQKFDHHWGRTITESDNTLFTTITLSFVPLYFNRAYARQQGHPDIVLNPQLVFNVALGLSVEDCSEAGGPFLGVYDLRYHRPAYPGVTLTASSSTVEARISGSNPAFGIVTWETEGRDQDGNLLVSFRRSNLVRRREGNDQ
ncbi:MaoC family dehydratase [Rhizorhapis suberifaciens]|uniref:Acyl dehydratase n=1 Tax=Rhizorhapis suberifaciens TaxID=13656 RepID=A0A840HXD9_9SPHN|nr:MaoC family dehydratase [Rhizorhapis suberifaciens]MBB4642188.1 acyl dehydratase [Rhizorhapis suberifaciens]